MAPPLGPPRPRKRSKGSAADFRFGSNTGRVLVMFSVVAMSWGLFIITKLAGPELAPAVTAAVDNQLAAVVGGGRGADLMAAAVAGQQAAASLRAWNEVEQDDRFYLVFSTDCTGYQNWQSLAVFFSADDVRQPGTLVRIASGCTEEEKKEIQALYDQFPARFQVHFTPDFKKDAKSGKSYDFYNKPYGLEHWLDSPAGPRDDNAIVALLDPDFLFLRPLTYKVKRDRVLFSPTVTEADLIEEVSEGHPVAQHYGIGSHWTKFKVGYIAGADSPATKVNISYAYEHYSVGPPYIVHVRDMQRIAKKWAECVPKVYEEYPELLAEMYAYSIAAAHLELPHLRLDHYMVSNIDASGEGWPFVDQLEEYACSDYPDLGMEQPVFQHYCQFYRVEHWGFHKRRVDPGFFSCDSPLFLVPPDDLEDTHWKEDPYKKTLLSKRQAQHAAFSLCNIVKRLNRAATKYKNLFCPAGTANYTMDIKIW